jgi:hypothetical protein
MIDAAQPAPADEPAIVALPRGGASFDQLLDELDQLPPDQAQLGEEL